MSSTKEYKRRVASDAQSQAQLAALTERIAAAEACAATAINGLAAARTQAQYDHQELAALRPQMDRMTQTVQQQLTRQAPAASVVAATPWAGRGTV
jgi:hypothetical protein